MAKIPQEIINLSTSELEKCVNDKRYGRIKHGQFLAELKIRMKPLCETSIGELKHLLKNNNISEENKKEVMQELKLRTNPQYLRKCTTSELIQLLHRKDLSNLEYLEIINAINIRPINDMSEDEINLLLKEKRISKEKEYELLRKKNNSTHEEFHNRLKQATLINEKNKHRSLTLREKCYNTLFILVFGTWLIWVTITLWPVISAILSILITIILLKMIQKWTT